MSDARTDEELMQRFCDGDAAAFDPLFQRYSAHVTALLTRMVYDRSVAEDLAQTTFLSLIRSRERYLRGASVRSWILAIAVNAARDWLRSSKRLGTTGDEAELHAVAAEATEPVDTARLSRVRGALMKLPAPQREVITMHRFQALTFREISVALGISESLAKVRAHRGYHRLRKLLGDIRESPT